MCRFSLNRFRIPAAEWAHSLRTALELGDVRSLHRSLHEYEPTPLIDLPDLATRLGVRQITVKDESERFGLDAFKALGASYAIFRLIADQLKETTGEKIESREFYQRSDLIPRDRYIFCTATDGNHGRGVAWAARKLGQRAIVFVPQETVPARIEAIESEGAPVVVVPGTYDETVARAAIDADQNGWQLVSDTSWDGYTEIPGWIMAGYTTIFDEIDEAAIQPDIVIVQGGVGALSASAAWYYNQTSRSHIPKLISVEPTQADCLLESIRSPDGTPTSTRGTQQTMMAGLNCGTPSHVAWPLIRAGYDLFLGISDEWCVRAMRTLYHSENNDPLIVAGESGAAGLAGLLALIGNSEFEAARHEISLNSDSSILLLNTEGDTDPVQFERLVRFHFLSR